MRYKNWIGIALIGLAAVWAYRQWGHTNEEMVGCASPHDKWDTYSKACDPHAKQNCLADGYQWDDDGNRCLVNDYLL